MLPDWKDQTEADMRTRTRMVSSHKIPILGYKHKTWEHRRNHTDEISILAEWNGDGEFKILDAVPRDDDYKITMAICTAILTSLGYHRYIKVVDTLESKGE